MRAEFEKAVEDLLWESTGSIAVVTPILELVANEYEFKCPSFIYGGPGHQSLHKCERHRPHGIGDEHHNSMGYEWTGTAIKLESGGIRNPPDLYESRGSW